MADPFADVWDDARYDRDEPTWLAAGDDDDIDVELALLSGTVQERLTTLLTMRPSGLTLTALERIAQLPMTQTERVLFAQAMQRQADAVTGMATAALADALGPQPPDDEPDLMAVECGLALRVSPDAMREKARFARKMRHTLSATLERWCAGVIGTTHARIVDDITVGLTHEQARELDERVAPKAERVSTTWFRRLCKREASRLDTRSAEDRHRTARRGRRAFLEAEPDGMSLLGVRLTAVEAVTAMQALNARADALRFDGDIRTHGERQADALLDLLLGVPITGPGEVRRRYRTEIQVGITLPALLGLRDDPGHLVGYGPIPAGAIRDLLGDEGSVLRRLVVDPVDGRLIDYGRRRYRPGDRLTAVTRAKERTCRFPDCTRPATHCDIDHGHDWDSGGETSEKNCHLLCRRHHRLKTFNGFRYDTDVDTGVTTWRTPLGLTYATPPGAYPEFVDPAPVDPSRPDPSRPDPSRPDPARPDPGPPG